MSRAIQSLLLLAAFALVVSGCSSQPQDPAETTHGDGGGASQTGAGGAIQPAPQVAAGNRPVIGAAPAEVAPLFIESKKVSETFPDDKTKTKREAQISVFTNGRRYEGEFKEWHPNGKLWKQGMFKENARHGEWKFWHENGNLAKTGQYVAGRLEGLWTFLRADGTKWREENWIQGVRNGVWNTYDDTGKRLTRQEHWKQNKRDGTWTTWHPNGEKATEDKYVDNLQHGTKSVWDEKGKLRLTVEFRNGKPHGKVIRWDETGKKLDERNFQDGEQQLAP